MIPAQYYHIIFLYTVILMTAISIGSVGKTYRDIKRGSDNLAISILICLILSLWLGLRPYSAPYFGDTFNYTHKFNLMRSGITFEDSSEWVWRNLMYFCSQTTDVTIFFMLVEIGYFGFTLWACRRLTPNNTLISLLFCFGAFSFYTYGINGIRNGLACSMILLFLSYLNGKKVIDKIIAAILAFLAFNIHHTTALPMLMSVVSLYFMRSFSWAYYFWILSIVLSLVLGNSIANIFAAMGFDDRMGSYLNAQEYNDQFSHTGFRWDFLLYSAMPIVLGYYAIIKRGIRNRTYEFLLNTYILSNAFWVMVIRAAFSNRFAYLSWFMYPLVLAYPLLRLDIWNDKQGLRLKQIMFAHVGFTWFMNTIYGS